MEPDPEHAQDTPKTSALDERRFQRYEIRGEISRGGMGVIYQAWDTDLNREVALKVLMGGPEASHESVQRFWREAKSIASLRHPSIVPIFDVGTEGENHFFTMEFVKGDNLHELQKRGEVDHRRAASIMARVADAIHHAHIQGVVHRDIKPGNVLVTPQGEVRVTDFGLARTVESDSRITQTGLTMGTPPYMSPEQARGRWDEVDEMSDVYSLGATLYELIVGRPPFEGDSGMDVLLKVVDDDPPSPRSRNPEIAKALEVITLKAMARDPENRYDTAREMAEDLRRFIEGKEILARKPRVFFSKSWKRVRRFVLANPILFVLFLMTLSFLTGAGTWQFRSFLTNRRNDIDRQYKPIPFFQSDDDTDAPDEDPKLRWAALEGVTRFEGDGAEQTLVVVPDSRTGRGVVVAADERFKSFRGGSIQISFNTWIPQEHRGPPPEIGCFLFASDTDPLRTGYRVAVGNGFAGKRVITKNGEIVRTASGIAVQPGRTLWGSPRYRFVVELNRDHLTLEVNGETAIEFKDDFPEDVSRREGCCWGVTVYGGSLKLNDIVIRRLGLPKLAGPLVWGDEHYMMGNFEAAHDRYSLARDSFIGEEAGRIAQYRMGLCTWRLSPDSEKVDRELEQLLTDYPISRWAHGARFHLARKRLHADPEGARDLLQPIFDTGLHEEWINRAGLLALQTGVKRVRQAAREKEAAPASDPEEDKPVWEKSLKEAEAFLALTADARGTDPWIRARALLYHGQTAMLRGNLTAAREMWRNGVQLADRVPLTAAVCGFHLALSLRRSNDDGQAVEELLDLASELRRVPALAAIATLEAAVTLRKQHRFDRASALLTDLRASRETGDIYPDLLAWIRLTETLALAERALPGYRGATGTATISRELNRFARDFRMTPFGHGTWLWACLRGEFDPSIVNSPHSWPPTAGGELINLARRLQSLADDRPAGGKSPVRPGPFAALASFIGTTGDLNPWEAALKQDLLGARPDPYLLYWLGLWAESADDMAQAAAFYQACTDTGGRDMPIPLAIERLRQIEKRR